LQNLNEIIFLGTDFETVFLRLVEIYHTSSYQERPEKIRKVLTIPGPSQIYIRELLNSFLSEGSLLEQQQIVSSQQLDKLYADILTLDTPNNLSTTPQPQ